MAGDDVPISHIDHCVILSGEGGERLHVETFRMDKVVDLEMVRLEIDSPYMNSNICMISAVIKSEFVYVARLL